MRIKFLALAGALAVAISWAATAGAQQNHSISHRMARTTVVSGSVTIHVTLTDSKVTLSRYAAPRATDARFIIRNVGTRVLSFQFGTQKPGLGQAGFITSVKPREQTNRLLFLDYRSVVPFFGSDHNKPGMRGKFKIGVCPKKVGTPAPGC